MYGQNESKGMDYHQDGSLVVNECYLTVQGEGPDTGHPAVFVRLAYCNLRCSFCDSFFDQGDRLSLDALLDKIEETRVNANLVVITGGEPLLQNIVPLVHALNDRGLVVSVETAGTVYCPGLDSCFRSDRSLGGNLIVCSPKTPRINNRIYPLVGAYKYIVKYDEVDDVGLPNQATQIGLEGKQQRIYRPSPLVASMTYIQPMDEADDRLNELNEQFAVRLCLQFGYRLSIQVHKKLGLP